MLNKQKNKLSGILLTISLFMVSQAGAGGFTQPPPENGSPPGVEQLSAAPLMESNANEALDRSATVIAHPASDSAAIPSDSPTLVVPDELAAMAGVRTDITTGLMSHEQGYIDNDTGLAPAGKNKSEAPNKAKDTNSQTPQLPSEDNGANNSGSNSPGGFVKYIEGKGNSGWRPPDVGMAVGKDYIVQTVNSGFEIHNLKGQVLQSYTTFSTFFNSKKPSGWSGYMFDPKVVWQPTKQRFVMMILGKDDTHQTSYYFIAISKTSDPTGAWWLYRYQANAGNTDSWLDYSSLAADTFGVYVTGNLFKWAGGFKSAQIVTFPDALYSGTGAGGRVYFNLKWPSGTSAFSLQAANPHTVNSDGKTFFVNSYSASGNKLLLWTLGAGNRSNALSLTKAAITTASTYHAIGNNVDQKGSTDDLDGGDARLQNAVYINRRVFTTLTSDIDNDGTSSGIITYELNTNTNTKVWEATLHNSSYYAFYPSVVVNGDDVANVNIGIYHNLSNATHYPGSGFKVYEDRATNNDGLWTWTKLGLGPYVSYVGTRNRFGDYSGSAYDWLCPGRAWGSSEYADTGSSNAHLWKTSIASYMLDGSPTCPLGRPDQLTSISPSGTISDTTPMYTWNADPDASWYHLYVNDSTGNKIDAWYSSATAGCSSGTGTCSVTPTTALAAGSGNWWVAGWNTYYGQGSWSAARSFTISSAPPAATLISPAGNITDNTPTYTWNAVSGSTWYYLWVNDSTGNRIKQWYTAAAAGCSSGTGTCSVTPATVLNSGAGTWWIQTYNSSGYGPWSAGKNFNLSGVPGAALLISPNGTTTSTPTYTWEAVSGSTWYYLWVNDSTGNRIKHWYTAAAAGCSSGTGTCSVTPTTVLNSGAGTWWIQTYNSSGYGPWSSGLNFTVP